MSKTIRFETSMKQMREDDIRWHRTRKVPKPAPPCECKIEGRRCTCAIPPIFGDYGGRFPEAA